MPFKLRHGKASILNTPEELFRDIKGKKIPGLLSHQADIIRDYIKIADDESDIAFQLPTGSGKTLVGLLIAEWRRRKYNEQILYLCPTNQLVKQVVEQAIDKYGIDVICFTGPKSDYSSKDKNDFINAEKIGITSYSSLFNIKPYFDEPDIIILDDIHAAENYIANNWSLSIDKNKNDIRPLFDAILTLVKKHISPIQYHTLISDEDDRLDLMNVDKLPTPVFYELIPEIVPIIEQYKTADDNILFTWQLLKNNLNACHFYYNSRTFLIRPLIPPTFTSEPFVKAKQRIYMSATLGEGGDLERLTGVEKIHRLTIPQGWDKQGIGRRFFIFPERSLSEEKLEIFLEKVIKTCNRALILAPNDKIADKFKVDIKSKLDYQIFNAKQIENSKKEFVTTDKAVAVVANRYDGIDLIDDECRLLIINEISKATNLQERFLVSRMGAVALLNDRMLTRVMQAIGRCTRSATDYAVVIIIGQELINFIVKPSRMKLLHPELQAEIEFGIEQSKDMSVDKFIDNITVFLDQGREWQRVDQEILAIREMKKQQKMAGTNDLYLSVKHEIKYQKSLWYGNYIEALDCAKSAIAVLNDDSLRGYRALWYYLTGSAAWYCKTKNIADKTYEINECFRKAAEAAKTLDWLYNIGSLSKEKPEDDNAQCAVRIVEKMELELGKLGMINNSKFEKYVAEIIQGLDQDKYNTFENSHVLLGILLGYAAGNKDTNGAPDPWWLVNDKLCFVFEDNSEAKSTTALCINKARQAATHPDWIKGYHNMSSDAEIISVIITSSKAIDKDAKSFLTNVYIWDINDFRKWAKNAIAVVRELRKSYPGQADIAWRDTAIKSYIANQIDPISLKNKIVKKPASSYPTNKK